MSYSLSQYAEMHYYYGVAQGNGSEAARLYQEALERRREVMEHYPDHRVFINTHNNLMAGRIPGRNQPHGAVPQDPDQVEEVLEEIQRDPSTSSRKITRRTGIPRTTVIRILKEEGFYAYHIQRVQQLQESDYPRRVAFCETMIQRSEEDPDFFNKILWTYESRFERTGVFNIHNYHSWAIENPHLARASNFQTRFSVNLWSGVLNGELIGAFELPARLNGNTYLNFLQNNLYELLEDVNLQIRQEMIFQQDGAPCHYALQVREHLNTTFPGRWIGRAGPIEWPARSPDLNPIDFFVWGFYKEMVYATESNNETELRQKNSEAERKIKQEYSSSFRQLKHNFLKRFRLCIQVGGRNFENLL